MSVFDDVEAAAKFCVRLKNTPRGDWAREFEGTGCSSAPSLPEITDAIRNRQPWAEDNDLGITADRSPAAQQFAQKNVPQGEEEQERRAHVVDLRWWGCMSHMVDIASMKATSIRRQVYFLNSAEGGGGRMLKDVRRAMHYLQGILTLQGASFDEITTTQQLT